LKFSKKSVFNKFGFPKTMYWLTSIYYLKRYLSIRKGPYLLLTQIHLNQYQGQNKTENISIYLIGSIVLYSENHCKHCKLLGFGSLLANRSVFCIQQINIFFATDISETMSVFNKEITGIKCIQFIPRFFSIQCRVLQHILMSSRLIQYRYVYIIELRNQ